MVYLSSHGGSCCGARHIHNFGTGDLLRNITQMHNHVASAPDRLTEIILNRTQCENSPRLLAAMAERGFVLTTGFKNGNHDSDVFVFHRSDRRLRLDNTERDFGFNWAGQIACPTLHGNLTPLQEMPNPPAERGSAIPEHLRRRGAIFHTGYLNEYPADMALVYDGLAAHLRGQLFTLPNGCRRWSQVYYHYCHKLRVLNIETGVVKELAVSSFRIHSFTQQAPQQPEAPRQPDFGNQRYVLDVERGPDERIVYTTFHNVYRDGRIGAGYPTSQEARDAAPRALQRLTRHIYNTGRVEDVIG